jgi:C4-dicarboxylate transporter DctQ subunit
MSFMKTVDSLISKTEDIISALAMLSMCLVVFASVIWRYVLHLPFASGEEIARYLMVWCIYIGVSVATRENAHVNVTVLINMLPPKARRFFVFLGQIITIATFCWLFALSVMLIQKSAGGRVQLTPLTRLPYWYMYLSMGLGFGLSILREVQITVKEFFLNDGADSTPGEAGE